MMFDDEDFYANSNDSSRRVNNRSPNLNQRELELGGALILNNIAADEDSRSSHASTRESDEDTDNESQRILQRPPQGASRPAGPDYVTRTSGQHQIVSNVVTTLIDGKNLLVEQCPPGKERKIAIIKGKLDFWQWRKQGKRLKYQSNEVREGVPNPSRMYIGTRNIRESKELLKEMKQQLGCTGLLDNVRVSVLDHRKNFCINSDVTGGNSSDDEIINHACRQRCRPCSLETQMIPPSAKKPRRDVPVVPPCQYYANSMNTPQNAKPFVHNSSLGVCGPQDIADIEECTTDCMRTTRCPYHDNRHLAQDADLIICPVEFLLSPHLREEYSIQLDNAIILIDDGFDLEALCRQEATLSISVEDLMQASSLLKEVVKHHPKGLKDLKNFRKGLIALTKWAKSCVRKRPRANRDDILKGIMNSSKIKTMNMRQLERTFMDCVEKSANRIPDSDAYIIEDLRKFMTTLDFLATSPESFCVDLTEQDSPPNSDAMDVALKIICTNPAIIMQPIGNAANSIIVGASVIAPYSPFQSSFGITFHETLKIEHDDPIARERLLVAYTGVAANGVEFALNFSSRDAPEVKMQTGYSMWEIAKAMPHGTIGVFHSKEYFDVLRKYWKRTPIEPNQNGMTIWQALESVTNVFYESEKKNETETQIMMKAFQEAATTSKGALLLALHRGKLYKNWDLNYDSVRCVVHISIPYGPWYSDPYIIHKRKSLERMYERDCLENKDWYFKEAFRTANQSFCCCLKKENDYGVVIFLDSRMGKEMNTYDEKLPKWVNRPFHYQNFSRLMIHVKKRVAEWPRAITENV